jgi:hypothetical protein
LRLRLRPALAPASLPTYPFAGHPRSPNRTGTIQTPSWLLLLWCGFAASLASEWIVAMARAVLARGRDHPSRSGPRLMSTPRGSVPIAVLLGTLVSAPVYGLIFEWWHRADLAAGLLLGTIHGTVAGLIVLVAFLRRRRRDNREMPVRPLAVFRARRLITRVLYGAVLGFLYVVPPT